MEVGWEVGRSWWEGHLGGEGDPGRADCLARFGTRRVVAWGVGLDTLEVVE